MDIKYYELDFDNNYGMLIKGVRKPSIKEANDFVKHDLHGSNVVGVFSIEETEARAFYDFTNENRWPIFGL